MSWAKFHIEKLQAGETVSFRPRGNSMTPKITSGALCVVRPLEEDEIPQPGEIVLCRVKGSDYLHLVKGVREDALLIGNNHGHINGWSKLKNVYGVLVSVGE